MLFAYTSSLSVQLLGIRIGSLLEACVAMLASVAIAFGFSWLTAIVVLLLMPLIALASGLHFSAAAGTESQSLKAVSASTEVRSHFCAGPLTTCG